MTDPLKNALQRSGSILFPLLVAFVFAAGFFLRFHNLTITGLWADELFTVVTAIPVDPNASWLSFIPKNFTELTIHDSFLTRAASDNTPPLFTLMLAGWAHVFGISDMALRSMGSLIGSLAPVVVYFGLRRPLGKTSALLAAAMLAFSPAAVVYSRTVRAYTLTIFLTAVAVVRLIQRVSPPPGLPAKPETGFRSFWVDVVIYILLAYTHYTGFFAAGALAGLYFFFVILPRKRYADISKLLLVPLALAPWLWLALRQIEPTVKGTLGFRDYSLSEVWTMMVPLTIDYLLIGNSIVLPIVWATALVFAVTVVRENGRWISPFKNLRAKLVDWKVLLALGFAVVVCLQFAFNAFNSYLVKMWMARYCAPMLPVVFASIALLFSATKTGGKLVPVILCAAMIWAGAGTLPKYFEPGGPEAPFEQDREASQYVASIAQNNPIVIGAWAPSAANYLHYLRQHIDPATQPYDFVTLSSEKETNEFCATLHKAGRHVILMQFTEYPYVKWLSGCKKELRFVSQKEFRAVTVAVFEVKRQ